MSERKPAHRAKPARSTSHSLYVGIDVGTSGCRTVAIDESATPIAASSVSLPAPTRLTNGWLDQDPELWWEALGTALATLLDQIPRKQVRALAIDGTSGSVLVADTAGRALAPALLYNDNRAVAEAERLRNLAPRESAAHGTSSGLAKAMWLRERHPDAARIHTPADWLGARLCGRYGVCDANNVIKLGWDPVNHDWPAWIEQCVPRRLLPEIVAPGAPLGPITKAITQRFGLSPDTQFIAGTTDSTAAILATGAHGIGDGITSLGSTLVMKVITAQPLFAPEYGIYSQPYGGHWLVGGGSNSGGAVLRHYFTDIELAQLERRLHPLQPTGLDYYPLLAPGERFPVNDPVYPPRLTPRPADDAEFLQGLLEGLTRIETAGYRRLEELGAPYPRRVLTAGGGSRNTAWTAMRARLLQVPVERAAHDEAAYGTALLASGRCP